MKTQEFNRRDRISKRNFFSKLSSKDKLTFSASGKKEYAQSNIYLRISSLSASK